MEINSNVRNTMILYGFDFLLKGTSYIYEMVLEMANNFSFRTGSKLMQYISDKHDIKLKSMNREGRWAIFNATKRGETFNTAIPTKILIKKIYNAALINC